MDESMVANFSQYGLSSKYLGVIAADFCLSPWRNCQMFQCIITDPPYGIREATEKIGMLLVFGISFSNSPPPRRASGMVLETLYSRRLLPGQNNKVQNCLQAPPLKTTVMKVLTHSTSLVISRAR